LGVKFGIGLPIEGQGGPVIFLGVEDLVKVRGVSSPDDFLGVVNFEVHLVLGGRLKFVEFHEDQVIYII
jgi:hypothetical protein